jgi:hypothetical protein
MLRTLYRMIDPKQVPLMMRSSYRREMAASATMPLVMALIEGGVAGVIAKKVFDVGDWTVAVITAAPMFANLTSFIWAHLARGRRKVRFITALQITILLLITAIATLPETVVGGYAMAALVVAARCMFSGIVTVRSTIWRQNYRREMRGQITGRFARLATLMMVLTGTAVAIALDGNASAFRIAYPAAAVLASLGVVAFSGLRVRQERQQLAYEAKPTAKPTPHGSPNGIYEFDRKDESFSVWAVLKNDPVFRSYLACQFLAGVSNMMSEPVFVALVADATEPLGTTHVAGRVISLEYIVSILLTMIVPTTLAMIVLPRWGSLLDRLHVVRYRVRHTWVWPLSQIICFAGGYMVMFEAGLVWGLVVLGVGRFVLGIARGGGMIAWMLGHNDFASRRMTSVYMGIHVTLTGVRGAFAPFLGVALYTGWPLIDLGMVTIPEFKGIGPGVFAVSALLSLIAWIGFWRLARRMGATAQAVDAD